MIFCLYDYNIVIEFLFGTRMAVLIARILREGTPTDIRMQCTHHSFVHGWMGNRTKNPANIDNSLLIVSYEYPEKNPKLNSASEGRLFFSIYLMKN